MSCEFTPMSAHQRARRPSARHQGHRCGQATPCQASACAVRCHADHTLTAAEVEAIEHAEAMAEERWATAWVLAGVGLVATPASCLGYLVCALGLL